MSATPTVILRINKDTIKIYYRNSWGNLNNKKLLQRIYYWLAGFFYYKEYPFDQLWLIAESFPALKSILPTLLDTFEQNPDARIKLVFGAY